MRVLLVWESKHASTAEMALVIGEVLRTRGLRVDLREVASAPDDVRYDAYIIGSAVYSGHWMKRIKQYLRDNRELLLSHRVWLFSSGPVGRPPRPAEPPADLSEIFYRTSPRNHMIFAGKLDKAKLSFPERAIVAAMRAPEGDFRDWDAIRGWAGQIADELTEDRLPPQRG